jgi:transcriptional regulator with XRE-family HTH domain
MNDEQWDTLKTMYLQAMASEFREERKFQALQQDEAASRSGLTRATISDLENARNWSQGTALQYAVGLGIPFSVMVARAERRLTERLPAAGLPTLAAYAV